MDIYILCFILLNKNALMWMQCSHLLNAWQLCMQDLIWPPERYGWGVWIQLFKLKFPAEGNKLKIKSNSTTFITEV